MATLTDLYSFLIVHSSNHLHTSVCQLRKIRMFMTKIPKDFDNSLPHAHSRILQKIKRILYTPKLKLTTNTYQYTSGQHVIVVLDQFRFKQNEFSHEVDRCFSHTG